MKNGMPVPGVKSTVAKYGRSDAVAPVKLVMDGSTVGSAPTKLGGVLEDITRC